MTKNDSSINALQNYNFMSYPILLITNSNYKDQLNNSNAKKKFQLVIDKHFNLNKEQNDWARDVSIKYQNHLNLYSTFFLKIIQI